MYDTIWKLELEQLHEYLPPGIRLSETAELLSKSLISESTAGLNMKMIYLNEPQMAI